jgi:hypothetical protein
MNTWSKYIIYINENNIIKLIILHNLYMVIKGNIKISKETPFSHFPYATMQGMHTLWSESILYHISDQFA